MTTLRQLAEAATSGPWQVITDEHPHYHGGTHKERRIFTVWHHPQLKGPWGIVNNSVGIGAEKGGPARHMVSIEEKNADYIAAANPTAILALLDTIDVQRRLLERAEAVLVNSAYWKSDLSRDIAVHLGATK